MEAPIRVLLPVSAVTLAALAFALAIRPTTPAESRQSPPGTRRSPSWSVPHAAFETSRETADLAVVSDRAEGIVELAPIVIVVPAPPASSDP